MIHDDEQPDGQQESTTVSYAQGGSNSGAQSMRLRVDNENDNGQQQEMNGGYQGLEHELELLDQERQAEQEGPAQNLGQNQQQH